MSTKNNKGQGTLEFFLIVAFVTVSFVIVMKFFYPQIKMSFGGVGDLVEESVASGESFK